VKGLVRRLLIALLLSLLLGLAIGTALRLRLERPVVYIGGGFERAVDPDAKYSNRGLLAIRGGAG
jgi:hypothetical protein